MKVPASFFFLAATMLVAPAAARDGQDAPPRVELNSPAATAEDRAVLHAFARCVAGRFAPELFVGGMAERLLDRDVQDGTLGARVALDPDGSPLSTTDQAEIMSLCIVRAAPTEVETLFSTTPGSREETTALQAIGPGIAPCLARGAELRVNRPGLRAMLARAAYRLVRHNAAGEATQ